ncbi:MAG: hypothetical protein NXI31_12410 [bacterium]|nr:hypothetical protein [bacterium]
MTSPQPANRAPASRQPESHHPEPARWAAWHCVAVRYLLLHWLLYAFPKPLGDLGTTLLRLPATLFGSDSVPSWVHRANHAWSQWAEKPREWWEGALTWLQHQNMTFGAEMIHTSTIRSDTCAAWTRVAYIAAIAAFLTTIWTLIDRRGPDHPRSGHPRLGRWLHLGARWYLALYMLEYAWPKFVGSQFSHPTIQQLTWEVGDLTPSGVLWRFMGNSATYSFLGGLGELAGFALLLHRRTALLGAGVTTLVMANVCAFNWLYDVPLKQFSTHLVLIAIGLIAPFRHRLWSVLWRNDHAAPVDLRVTRSRWLGWPLLVTGTVWALAACYHVGSAQIRWRLNADRTTHAIPALYGLWRVESMVVDGNRLPSTDVARWRDVAIDRGNRVWIRTRTGRSFGYRYDEDLDTMTIALTPTSGNTPAFEWQVERGIVIRKAFHPAPRRPEDFRTMVDVERDALTFRGEWQGRAIEVRTVKKTFNYDRDPSLITEWPKSGR